MAPRLYAVAVMASLWLGLQRSRRELLLGARILRQMHRSEDDFKVWLAPFLHGKQCEVLPVLATSAPACGLHGVQDRQLLLEVAVSIACWK